MFSAIEMGAKRTTAAPVLNSKAPRTKTGSIVSQRWMERQYNVLMGLQLVVSTFILLMLFGCEG